MANSKSAMNGSPVTGFVKTQGKFTAEYQRKILEEKGVTRIVNGDKEGFDFKYALSLLCGDEVLYTVGGFRPLGAGRYTMNPHLEALENSGFALVDIQTGLRSDRNGATMLSKAIAKVLNKRVGPSTADAKRRGHAGTEKQWAELHAKRMPVDEARVIWLDTSISKEQALADMPGWTESTAYRYFKRRRRPSGRPKKRKKSKS